MRYEEYKLSKGMHKVGLGSIQKVETVTLNGHSLFPEEYSFSDGTLTLKNVPKRKSQITVRVYHSKPVNYDEDHVKDRHWWAEIGAMYGLEVCSWDYRHRAQFRNPVTDERVEIPGWLALRMKEMQPK